MDLYDKDIKTAAKIENKLNKGKRKYITWAGTGAMNGHQIYYTIPSQQAREESQ